MAQPLGAKYRRTRLLHNSACSVADDVLSVSDLWRLLNVTKLPEAALHHTLCLEGNSPS
jgi:hypothetical protein